MTPGIPAAGRLTEHPAWKALDKHHRQIRTAHLRELFASDPRRGERLTVEAAGVYLDYSKNRITDDTVRLLVRLAEDCGLRSRIDAHVRAARRSTSRNSGPCSTWRCARRATPSILVDGKNVVPDVHAVLDRMADFANRVRRGGWTGAHRQADLQRRQHRHRRLRPRPGHGLRGAHATTATARLTVRFVSNIDGTDFVEAVRDLDPAVTLFIVSSKTFTTLETMTNARTARAVAAGGVSAATRPRSRSTSSRSRPMPRRSATFGIDHRQHVRVLGLGRRTLLDGRRRSACRRC